MAWQDAIALSELQGSERKTVVISGHKILFIWHKEEVHAMQAKCPHLKLPLTFGELTEECTIICPFHKSEFNYKTGKVKCWSPWPAVIGNWLGKLVKQSPLKIYPTRIAENGQVQVEI